MGMYDVDDLTNKIDVGSQPGTMWSLSSQKPGHGLAELRDSNPSKLWQSDGLLPHLINIQFARRTAVTHVSLFVDFKDDDSYTPNKIRILAGTHFHDLVEVRLRELKEPSGWKHFVLDKFDNGNESDDVEADEPSSVDLDDSRMSSSSSSSSYSSPRQSPVRDEAQAAAEEQRRRRRRQRKTAQQGYIAKGVSERYPPIHAYLVQICVLSNHAAGKDTHIRGIHIFGPPTATSLERARRDKRLQRTSLAGKGSKHALDSGADETLIESEQRAERRRVRARASLQQWANATSAPATSAHLQSIAHQSGRRRDGHDDDDPLSIHTSRRLNVLSSLR